MTMPSEMCAIVGTIDPDAYGTGEELSDTVDMSKWGKLKAVVMVGTLGSSATIDAKLTQATASDGTTGLKDITNAAITQLTQAGSDSDKQVVIEISAEDLDTDNGYRYATLSVTVGTATSDAGAILLGFEPRYAPASDNDLASVDEIVQLVS